MKYEPVHVETRNGFSIEVSYDEHAESPRQFHDADSLTTLAFRKHRGLPRGDKELSGDEVAALLFVVDQAAYDKAYYAWRDQAPAEDGPPYYAWSNQEPDEADFRVPNPALCSVVPISAYIHSGTVIRAGGAGQFHDSYDACYAGLGYVTWEAARKNWPDKTDEERKALAREALLVDIAIFGYWVEGACFDWVVKDQTGEVVDSCCGYYGSKHDEHSDWGYMLQCARDAVDAHVKDEWRKKAGPFLPGANEWR